jgi:hypothetical protein
MSPHAFLRATLALPVLVPLLALASGSLSQAGFFLVMSLAFGGVPYLITAAILWFAIARCRSRRSAIRLILLAPLLFAPLQGLAWLAWAWLHPSESTGPAVAVGLGTTGLLFGYIYAVLVVALFLLVSRFSLVSSFPADVSAQAEANAA